MKKKLNSPESLQDEGLTFDQFEGAMRIKLRELHVSELPLSVGNCQKETLLVSFVNIKMVEAFLAGMEFLAQQITGDESSDSPDDNEVDEATDFLQHFSND